MEDDVLAGLDPASSRALGTFYQRLGARLLALAAYHESLASANARRRARAAESRRAALAVDRLVLDGIEPEAAIAEIAGRLGLDPAQVGAWWHQGRARPRLAARQRDMEIMRLAARGWSNPQLAAKFSLSQGTISRIVRRMLREKPRTAAIAETPQAARDRAA